VTPVTAGLAAVALAAAGFLGGVEVQKGNGSSGSSGAAAGGPPSFAAGGAAAASSTSGEVTSTRGGTLYVQTSDGTTVRVKTTGDSTVTRTAEADADDIKPGDTVARARRTRTGASPRPR
jgi:hypothetical protein